MFFYQVLDYTETGSVYLETRETVTISNKRECLGSRGLKPSNEKSNAREHIPSRGLSFSHALFLMISGRSSALIVTYWCNMIQLKVFYNISSPEDRCEVITTEENQLSNYDDLMQIAKGIN